MTPKEITRLAVYALALVVAGVIAVLAYVHGDTVTMSVALGWIATNVLAGWNINTSKPEPLAEHGA